MTKLEAIMKANHNKKMELTKQSEIDARSADLESKRSDKKHYPKTVISGGTKDNPLIISNLKNVLIVGDSYVIINNGSEAVVTDTTIARVYNNSSVTAKGNSTVCAFDNAVITPCGYSTCTANDDVYVNSLKDHAKLYLFSALNDHVRAFDDAIIFSFNKANVIAEDHSTIYAFGDTSVMAFDSTRIYAHDFSKLYLRYEEGRRNLLGIKSKVYAYDNASVYFSNPENDRVLDKEKTVSVITLPENEFLEKIKIFY